jgi:hypothetical protein
MNATAMFIAGTAVQAIGAIQQGNAANAAAKYNAQVARNNAIAARQTAAANAAREERLSRKRLGTLRAGVGASGITLEGTPLDLFEDSAAEEELQRLSILHGGEVESIGFENTSQLELARGRAAKRAGYMKAASTILLGGAKASAASSTSSGGSSSSTQTSQLNFMKS